MFVVHNVVSREMIILAFSLKVEQSFHSTMMVWLMLKVGSLRPNLSCSNIQTFKITLFNVSSGLWMWRVQVLLVQTTIGT